MKRKMHNVINGMLLSALGFAAGANADDFHPSHLNIRHIQYGGSGCPAGTVAQNVSPDTQAFTLLFDSFVAQTAPGLRPSDARKNCSLAIDFDYPSGWQFSVVAADTRGYAALDYGVEGQQVTAGYFQGSREQFRIQQNYYGPTAEDYLNMFEIPLASTVWSPCGQSAVRALILNTQVRLLSSNRLARGLMTVDSLDGSVLMTYSLNWRRC